MTAPSQHPQPEYFLVTKEELNLIKNDCFHPETDSCDGCEYATDPDVVCAWKGANALMDEVLTRPYTPARNDSDEVIKELIDFDRWFSGRHVGGQSPIIPEVRQEVHRRIEQLRKQGEQNE